MTYLQLVNNVLRRLRESEVTTVNQTSYSTLIGDFINHVKEEMEDAADWNVLRNTIQITTVSDSFNYVLTGADSRAKILDVFHDTKDYWMYEKNGKYMTANLNTAPVTTDSPLYYNINGVDTSGDLQVDLFPIPNAAEVINFNMVIPEDTLADDADTTALPSRALILGAWAMAISERGEDGGVSFDEAAQRYSRALSDAIALDASTHSYEFILEVR